MYTQKHHEIGTATKPARNSWEEKEQDDRDEERIAFAVCQMEAPNYSIGRR